MLNFFKIFSSLLLLYIGIVSAIKNENHESIREFRYCLRKSEQPSLRACVGRTALSFLKRFDERDNFTIADNFVASRDDSVTARSFVNFFDTDPEDFRSILENAGAVFSQRSLEFHMDSIYPGLMFKIGPTADSNSVAQFALDSTVNERNNHYEEPSTARILTKHYVLPFLLGLKFNLVALVPILFTVICLLLKKSLFIAKLVLFISSILGVGGIAGALSKFGGFESLFGGYGFGAGVGGLPLPPPGHFFGGPPIGGPVGVFPGKNNAYAVHDQDELEHVSPYKRHDRKVVFEKATVNAGRTRPDKKNNIRPAVEPYLSTASPDRFYEYESKAFVQDRSAKGRTSSASLRANSYNEETIENVSGSKVPTSQRFQTSDNNGWTVLNVRPS